MAQGVYAPLYTREREALIRLAQMEDRDPRRQAARFIREGLERAGALTDEQKYRAAGSRAAAVEV